MEIDGLTRRRPVKGKYELGSQAGYSSNNALEKQLPESDRRRPHRPWERMAKTVGHSLVYFLNPEPCVLSVFPPSIQ